MTQRQTVFRRAFIFFAAAILLIVLIVIAGCLIIQSVQTSSAQQQVSLGTLSLGKESVAFSGESLSNSGWLKATFSPDDIYQLKFYNGDQCNNLIVSSTGWISQTDADGNAPIIQKIPDYIASEGYDRITVTPISGDGNYSVADFSLLDSMDASRYGDCNIIDFEIKQYEIEISEDDYEKIEAKRDEALDIGILVSSDSDEVSAKIRYEGEKYSADLRLKGDWTDHLTKDQWSLRIDLSGDYCIAGLQKFSLQPIATRNGIWEYLVYEMYREQGGVALRYDFADVFVNGVYKGVYAVEEFCSKRTIENSQKREGPIIKISEDFMWDHWAYYESDDLFTVVLDDSTEVFSEKKTISSDTLSSYASYAITQLNKLRNGEVSTDEVLDIDLYARLHAVLDIFSCTHGRIWHNMRNYYNPITGLLEPIPFDEYAFSNLYVLADKNEYLDYWGFNDCEEYQALYKQYVMELSQDYPAFIERHQETIDQYITTIQRYNATFSMDVNDVDERIQELETMFYYVAEPVFSVYYDEEEPSYFLSVTNENLLALYITDIQNSDGESYEAFSDVYGSDGYFKVGGHSTEEIKLSDSFDISQLIGAEFIYHTTFSEEMTSSLGSECITWKVSQ